MHEYRISQSVLLHIFNKHKDLVKKLSVNSPEMLKQTLMNILKKADEVYVDAFEVKYYIKNINNLHINVVVKDDEVKTAYLLSTKTYNRMRRRRWIRRQP